MVPCASHLALTSLADSTWNTSTNSRPMILRFCSGSATPARWPMNWSSASTRITFTPRFLANMSITILPSSRRSRPWSTNTQVSWSPMARWISAAATDESTPGQAEDHLIAADLGADLLDRFRNIVGHIPVRLAAADLVHEAAQHGLALHRVRHFRVPLHTVEAALLVGHGGDRAAWRVAHQLEAGRHVQHLVAVAHPHFQHAVAFVGDEVGDAVEHLGVAAGAHFGVAEFAHQAVLDLAAQLGRHGLHAVADPQHRHAQFEHGVRSARGVAFQGRAVAARQDHAGGAVVAHELVADVVGEHFGEHAGVAHAAGDQLGDLGAEIEDEDFRVHGMCAFKMKTSVRNERSAARHSWRGSSWPGAARARKTKTPAAWRPPACKV